MLRVDGGLDGKVSVNTASQRWVTTRFIDTMEHGKRAYIEVTVGGRPQDQAGLNRVLAEATQLVALVG